MRWSLIIGVMVLFLERCGILEALRDNLDRQSMHIGAALQRSNESSHNQPNLSTDFVGNPVRKL